MTPQEFIRKWKPVALTERAAAQSHFLDVCALLGHDDPVKADPQGEWFTFEKGVTKTGGGEGFADVWKRGHFAWEYKKKKRNLEDALAQLTRYAAALENPPLQVACDTDRFLIRTAWTNTAVKTHEIALDDLAEPDKLDLLRSVFFDPDKLRPKETRAAITKEAADKFSTIALRLQGRGAPEEIAHFVNQLVFCFFASSVKLLPEGFFAKLLKRAAQKPERARDYFNQLFAAMETGGEFDLTDIAWFNGGLFDGRRALALDGGDIGLLQAAASLDWSQIDPTIFGTLFERFLDPEKRGQIGAHYTDPDKIMMIVEPVILRPLREEWAEAKRKIEAILSEAQKKVPQVYGRGADVAIARAMAGPIAKAEAVRTRFLERLQKISILDPACGSGNFLYLALQGVKDIENKANLECEALGLAPRALLVGPEILHGIEINPLAAELARTTIWIGDIQWRRRNGIYSETPPILRKLDSIECRDALIAPPTAPPEPRHAAYMEAAWPEAEFIVGNPPFLGDKLMIGGLGEEYVVALRAIFEGRIPGGADLVTYWFAKALTALEQGRSQGVGLVATNSIRGGANRTILDRINESGCIFEAWSDEPWIVDGAAVRVSLICFSKKVTLGAQLDGRGVASINSDLSSGNFNVSTLKPLPENQNVPFIGTQKTGKFDVPGQLARAWLGLPLNPNGRPNSDVLRPWLNGDDIVGRSSDRWIIDYGTGMELREAQLYEAPFEHLKEYVYSSRQGKREARASSKWWLLQRPRPYMRLALRDLARFIVTPRVSKHRLFVWAHKSVLPDTRLVAIAREDDTLFGILHSRIHELWSLKTCSWHGVGNDPTYNAISCFETFPFPEGLTPNIPAADYAGDPRAIAIAEAAKRLDDLRNAWLNPPDLVRIEPEVYPTPELLAAGAAKIYPDRILPKDATAAAKLRERTLTKLYNEPPQWLTDAHRELDAAVAAAYGWPADISDEDALARLLELNLARADACQSAPAANSNSHLARPAVLDCELPRSDAQETIDPPHP